MSLETYKRKRNFRITSEPGPKREKGHGKPIFVIQEHHATRLHYDFRLEAEGVLKSWAVTKEPTLDPAVKRLAVEVEDHPIGYATFSGDIPEGQYGAGHVEIWDHGTYENVMATKPEPMTVAESIEAGHVEVELHGDRLKGKFALIRMKNDEERRNWLLIKMKDEHARPETADGDGHEAKPSGRKTKASSNGDGSSKKRTAKSATKRSARAEETAAPPDEVPTTNVDKVMFPEAGIMKGDVLDYYGRIADRMLPHLENRPITLERLPDGLAEDGPRFWQKNTPDYYPEWIPRVELETEQGETVAYTLVNDVQTLLYLVNQGALIFHIWMSRVEDLDRPDFVLFDLDPGDRPFSDVVLTAKELHEILKKEKVDSVPKTSGKSGLHVLTPWKSKGGYDEAREWAMSIAERLVERLPDIATIERSKKARAGRLYVDVMQNARGHHAVAPYTLRPTPTATVSTPLDWREVNGRLDPGRFTLETIFKRLARQAADPAAGIVSGSKKSKGKR